MGVIAPYGRKNAIFPMGVGRHRGGGVLSVKVR